MCLRLSCRRFLSFMRERSGLRDWMKIKKIRCERREDIQVNRNTVLHWKLIYRTYLNSMSAFFRKDKHDDVSCTFSHCVQRTTSSFSPFLSRSKREMAGKQCSVWGIRVIILREWNVHPGGLKRTVLARMGAQRFLHVRLETTNDNFFDVLYGAYHRTRIFEQNGTPNIVCRNYNINWLWQRRLQI